MPAPSNLVEARPVGALPPARPSGRGRRRRVVGILVTLGALVVFTAVVAASAYIGTLAEPPLVLPATAASTPTGSLDGTWAVARGSEAGFRVDQTVMFMSDVVGRTSDVTGTLVAADDQVTGASLQIDLARVTSGGKAQPQFAPSLDTKRHPTATFMLTEPITLPAVFANGIIIDATANGQLTMHGVTREVGVSLSDRRERVGDPGGRFDADRPLRVGYRGAEGMRSARLGRRPWSGGVPVARSPRVTQEVPDRNGPTSGRGRDAQSHVMSGMDRDELCLQPAVELARLVSNREVSSSELVDAHLRRIERVHPLINALVQLDAHRALEAARSADRDLARGVSIGPLHGVPFTAKDNFETAGIITAIGVVARASVVPSRNATSVSDSSEPGRSCWARPTARHGEAARRRTTSSTGGRTPTTSRAPRPEAAAARRRSSPPAARRSGSGPTPAGASATRRTSAASRPSSRSVG